RFRRCGAPSGRRGGHGSARRTCHNFWGHPLGQRHRAASARSRTMTRSQTICGRSRSSASSEPMARRGEEFWDDLGTEAAPLLQVRGDSGGAEAAERLPHHVSFLSASPDGHVDEAERLLAAMQAGVFILHPLPLALDAFGTAHLWCPPDIAYADLAGE